MVSTVEMRRSWDRDLWRTVETTPAGGQSILLQWRVEPEPVDSGAPRDVAEAISRVLTELGEVAFRWSGEPAWPHDSARLIAAPRRNPVERAVDWMRTSWPVDIVVTRSSATAAQLFDYEWELQGQVALVIDPARGSAETAFAALRDRRDWRSFALAAPVVALMAPAVDGDAAQFTVGSPGDLEDLVRRLDRTFGACGIGFRPQ